MILLLLLLCTKVFAWWDWKCLKTEDFTVFYRPSHREEAERLLEALVHHSNFVQGLSGNEEVGHTPVMLQDAGILANAWCDPLFKSIGLLRYPASANHMYQDWYRMVSVHEYTHMCSLRSVGEEPKLLVKAFGSLFYPNLYLPLFITEGVATYAESCISPYEGRMKDGRCRAYLLCKANEKRFPSIHEAVHNPLHYPLDAPYVYGGGFFDYLSKTYGEWKLKEFFKEHGSSLSALFMGTLFPYFGIGKAAKKVYGKSMKALFKDYRKWMHNLSKNWSVDGICYRKYGWGLLHLVEWGGRLYYVRMYPCKTRAGRIFYFSKIVEKDLQTGQEKDLVCTTSFFCTPLRVAKDKLLYGVYEIERGYGSSPYFDFGLQCALYEVDLKTRKKRFLFKKELRTFCPLPDGAILYAKDKSREFGSIIFRYEGGEHEKIFATDFRVEELLYGGGRIWAVARREGDTPNLYQILLKDRTLRPLVQSPYNEGRIYWAEGMLLFSANYGGRYNIYAYSPENADVYRLTNGGHADSGLLKNKKLYFVSISSDGGNIFQKELKELEEFDVPKERERVKTSSKLVAEEGGYLENLLTLFPSIHIYIPDPPTLYLCGMDAVGENFYQLLWLEEEFSLLLGSNIIKPLAFTLFLHPPHQGEIKFFYPLTFRMEPWRMFSLNLSFRKEKRAKVLGCGLDAGMKWPNATLFLHLALEVERKGWGSLIHREGVKGAVLFERAIRGSQISAKADGIWDKDNPESTSFHIRGYTAPFYTRCGGLFSMEYSFILAKIRKGLWNPNIFFEDLGISAFFDAAFGEDGLERACWGLELQQEVSACLGHLWGVWKIGVYQNKEGEKGVYYAFSI